MSASLLLNPATWDLVLDDSGNIAVAESPYSLAQDAACAIKTFLGECYYDTTVGVPYLTQILGKSPTPSLLKSLFVEAALSVPDVGAAQFFISAFDGRRLEGQIQVVSKSTGQVSFANFSAFNPQGV